MDYQQYNPPNNNNNNVGRFVVAQPPAPAAVAMNNNNLNVNNNINNINNNNDDINIMMGGVAVESVGAGPNVAHVVPVVPRLQRDRPIWSRVVPSNACLPPPRSGAASVVVKGRLYMFGGYGGGTGRLDDFYSFNFATNAWEEVKVLSDQKPGCRENNGVVISDSSRSIYLFGGYNGSNWLNDLWKFDIESQKWTCIQESSDPRPTDDINSALLGEAAAQQQQQQQRLLLQQGVVRGRVPSRRFGYVSVVHNNKLVLFGGFDGQRWLNDMYVFDFATKIWTEIQARGTVPSVRSCPAWAKDDTHVYIQGGYDGVERKSDFFALELATYTWVQMPSLGTPPSPRYFHSCCLYGNKMYLYGGYSGTERLADMFAYDFETNHWCEVDCANGEAPSGRSSLVAQVYENCLYVFGGYNGTTVLNDFYKFRLKPISIPPPLLVHDLRRLMNHPELSDVTFQVEDQLVYANRALLAVRSEYFRVMLYSGGMRESFQASNSNNNNNNTASAVAATANQQPIALLDVSYLVFLKVLEFLYTDTVSDVSLEIGIHLLIASEQFMLDRLKALCEEVIRREITVDNVIGILVASHRHNALGLKDIALEFILKNLNDPAIMRGLTDLKTEPDLLVEIIKRNSAGRLAAPSRELAHAQSSGPFGSGAEWNTRR